jgi:hypothetical protein
MRKTAIKKLYALSLFIVILAPVVFFPATACAYIDPNTGGMFFRYSFLYSPQLPDCFCSAGTSLNSFLCGFAVYFAKNSLDELPGNTWTRLTNWKTKAYI